MPRLPRRRNRARPIGREPHGPRRTVPVDHRQQPGTGKPSQFGQIHVHRGERRPGLPGDDFPVVEATTATPSGTPTPRSRSASTAPRPSKSLPQKIPSTRGSSREQPLRRRRSPSPRPRIQRDAARRYGEPMLLPALAHAAARRRTASKSSGPVICAMCRRPAAISCSRGERAPWASSGSRQSASRRSAWAKA